MDVRPEYQALVDGLPDLARQFGASLSRATLDDLGVLMAAVEHIDRVVDAVPLAGERTALSAAIIAALETGVPLTTDLDETLLRLRALAQHHGVLADLVAISGDALTNTERMRRTTSRDAYLAAIEREGELLVELALLFAPVRGQPLGDFLRAVGPPANLVDKLLDLRNDHRRGEVTIDPGVRTHAALAVRMVRRSLSASRLHPNLLRFTMWGLRQVMGLSLPELHAR